tara:strand:+ start:283 stop:453 length:171 start_codon:yes stop_codon:yes gene_type:complete
MDIFPQSIYQKDWMTLRDYFAAQAMQAFLINASGSDEVVAKAAYETADAMMKARTT